MLVTNLPLGKRDYVGAQCREREQSGEAGRSITKVGISGEQEQPEYGPPQP